MPASPAARAAVAEAWAEAKAEIRPIPSSKAATADPLALGGRHVWRTGGRVVPRQPRSPCVLCPSRTYDDGLAVLFCCTIVIIPPMLIGPHIGLGQCSVQDTSVCTPHRLEVACVYASRLLLCMNSENLGTNL